MSCAIIAQTHVSIWIGSHQNSNGGETSIVNSHYKDPRSKYMIYSKSIMFDKILERKLINYISNLMTL